MFLFIALVAIALVLAQFPGHVSMIVIVAAVIIPCHFALSTPNWRLLTYGGMIGIGVFGGLSIGLTYLLHIHLPRPPIRSGYDSGIPPEQEAFAQIINPYIVPLGFLLGAAVCLAWNRRLTNRQNAG